MPISADVPNTAPRPRTMMAPAVPVRLMTAFALERKGFTVTSGMSATAGERKVAMVMSRTRRTTIKVMRGAIFFRVRASTSARI